MLLQPHFSTRDASKVKTDIFTKQDSEKPGRFLGNTPNQSPPRTRPAWVQGVQEEKDESTFFLISGRPAGPGAPQASRQLQVDLTTQVRYCGNNRNILRITVRHALSHWLLWWCGVYQHRKYNIIGGTRNATTHPRQSESWCTSCQRASWTRTWAISEDPLSAQGHPCDYLGINKTSRSELEKKLLGTWLDTSCRHRRSQESKNIFSAWGDRGRSTNEK